MIENTGELPHRLQLGAQLEYLAENGHVPKDGEIGALGLTSYLQRLHDAEVILLVERTSDSRFLAEQLKAAEDAGRLFVQAPRPEEGGPPAVRDPAKAAWTLTRTEARDVEKYRAAKAAAVEAEANGGIPIILG